MARIEFVSTAQSYKTVSRSSCELRETNDCAVKAVALLCDVPYAEVHAKMAQLGRIRGKGTPYNVIRQAIKSFGFEIKQWTYNDMWAVIATYPGGPDGGHRNLRSITTHHPRRFKAAWAPLKNKRLLLGVKKHVAAYTDGVVADWSVNTSKRVHLVWEVTKNV